MAVFTKLNMIEVEDFLQNYSIGKLEDYSEIVDGIENTNYKIVCDETPYILTIFEKRVKEEDLPFFINLKLFLNENNFKCPQPIKNKEGRIINSIKNKSAIIISFINGEKIDIPNIINCNEVGKMVGNLHNLTVNFHQKRDNSLGIKEWRKLFNKCETNKEKQFIQIITELRKEIEFLEKSLPKDLPSGIIHADLFKDNIFFKGDKVEGVIDFYFSCFYFFLYDLSIVVNDWCFEDNGKIFKKDFFNNLITGYKTRRNLSIKELNEFNILLRAAAVRILITRLHDYIFHPKDAVLIKKDPHEYFNILLWHQNNKNLIA